MEQVTDQKESKEDDLTFSTTENKISKFYEFSIKLWNYYLEIIENQSLSLDEKLSSEIISVDHNSNENVHNKNTK